MSPQITCPHCGNTINLENRKEVDFEKIMYALGKSPKTFTELLAITNLPRKTLSLRLKDLCISGSIIKDGGYHLNSSIKPTNRIFGRRNGNGKMNRTMRHIGKNVQWIPVALIICLVVVAFGSAMMISQPAPSPATPTASFFYVPSSNIVTGNNLTFDAALSRASNGPITDYYWDFGDGSPSAYGQVATHTYVAEGIYTVTLTVTDAHGLTTSAQETVDVSYTPAPQSTAAINFTITPDPFIGRAFIGWENQRWVNRSLTFDASASDVPSGFKANYSWSFGDGVTGIGAVISHTYDKAGNYNVTLTVSDPESGVQSITQQVEILPMPAATIYVSSLPTQYTIGDTITLSITISNVTDLFSWAAGITFNSSVLQCITTASPENAASGFSFNTTAMTEGPFLKKGGPTIWIPSQVDNGTMSAGGASLLGGPPSNPAPSVTGSGVLATVEFKVTGQGVLNIRLTDVILIGADGYTEIPVYVAT